MPSTKRTNHSVLQARVLLEIMQSPNASIKDRLAASKQLTELKRVKTKVYRKQTDTKKPDVSVLGTR